MTIKEATIATLEDKRADLMDTIHRLGQALETADDGLGDMIRDVVYEAEKILYAVNSALTALEPPDRLTGYDN